MINTKKLVWMFEMVVVSALHVLIMLAVAIATIILFVLFVQDFWSDIKNVESIPDLLPAMQGIFAGVLVVLLGLELAETIKAYFADHHIRVEVILIVGIVAVGRHVIQLDIHHTGWAELLGVSALMLSLTGSYFLVKRAQVLLSKHGNDSIARNAGE